MNKWSTALGTFAYDAANQVTDTTDRIGQRVTYAYDGDGRETGETWYNASHSVTNRVTFTYDSAGNMLTAANSNAGNKRGRGRNNHV